MQPVDEPYLKASPASGSIKNTDNIKKPNNKFNKSKNPNNKTNDGDNKIDNVESPTISNPPVVRSQIVSNPPASGEKLTIGTEETSNDNKKLFDLLTSSIERNDKRFNDMMSHLNALTGELSEIKNDPKYFQKRSSSANSSISNIQPKCINGVIR
jgi:hypothetical protein